MKNWFTNAAMMTALISITSCQLYFEDSNGGTADARSTCNEANENCPCFGCQLPSDARATHADARATHADAHVMDIDAGAACLDAGIASADATPTFPDAGGTSTAYGSECNNFDENDCLSTWLCHAYYNVDVCNMYNQGSGCTSVPQFSGCGSVDIWECPNPSIGPGSTCNSVGIPASPTGSGCEGLDVDICATSDDCATYYVILPGPETFPQMANGNSPPGVTGSGSAEGSAGFLAPICEPKQETVNFCNSDSECDAGSGCAYIIGLCDPNTCAAAGDCWACLGQCVATQTTCDDIQCPSGYQCAINSQPSTADGSPQALPICLPIIVD